MPDEISIRDIERFTAIHGPKKGRQILSLLGSRHPFYRAMSTEVGQQILSSTFARLDDLMSVMFEKNGEDITADERAEYRVLKRCAAEWSDKIIKYEETLNRFKKGTEGK